MDITFGKKDTDEAKMFGKLISYHYIILTLNLILEACICLHFRIDRFRIILIFINTYSLNFTINQFPVVYLIYL